MRLIDADELIEIAHRMRLDSRERIEQMIESAPTVEPKHGHWISEKYPLCSCSVCGAIENADWAMIQCDAKCCPHCGAKMTGESDE